MPPEVEQDRRVMLAHGIAFVLNLWGLVKRELVELDRAQWIKSSGKLLGNLKSVLAPSGSGSIIDAHWRSWLNAITAANWPSSQTLQEFLDQAASKKHKVPDVENSAFADLLDASTAKRQLLSYRLALPPMNAPRLFPEWHSVNKQTLIIEEKETIIRTALEYTKRWRPDDTFPTHKERIGDFIHALEAQSALADKHIRENCFDLEAFRQYIRRVSFRTQRDLIQIDLSTSELQYFWFSDSEFSVTRQAVFARDVSRKQILQTISQIRESKSVKMRRMILLDSLEPGSYSDAEVNDLVLDILYQIGAGILVCLTRKNDACESVGRDANGHYLISFALTNTGTLMKADDTHTLWQVTKISPETLEFKRAVARYREFADDTSANHAFIYPHEYNELILHDQKKFAEFKHLIRERMYKAARHQL